MTEILTTQNGVAPWPAKEIVTALNFPSGETSAETDLSALSTVALK